MADIEYPQRWLREAKAITSPEGWRKEKTNELLKCQKGLESEVIPEQPVLKTVSISGAPTTLELDAENKAEFEVTYTWTDAEYTPINVVCEVASDNGGSTVTSTRVGTENKFKVSIVNGNAGEKVTSKIVIDTISSINRTTTLQEHTP